MISLLSRVWALATQPLEALNPKDHEDELRLFTESCIDPENGQIKVDIVRTLLPTKWRSELEQVSQTVLEEEIETEMPQEEPIYDNDSTQPKNAYILPAQVTVPLHNSITLPELQYNMQSQLSSRLIALNHKALTTDEFKVALKEGRLAVVFGRIEELKREDRWGLRQREKFTPPPRHPSHWDHLLSEAKFVRAGLHGDRRVKMANAHRISKAVLEHFALIEAAKMEDEFSLVAADAPVIIPKNQLDRISRQILERGIPEMHSFSESITEDKVVPISKFMTREIEDWKRIVIEDCEEERKELELTEIGEVKPEGEPLTKLTFKLRSDNEIRPPQPPSLDTVTYRAAPVWQQEDDDKLIRLVRELHNNWALIAESFSAETPSLGNGFGAGLGGYKSTAQRHTPWQIFERYVQIAHIDSKDFKGTYADAARKYFDQASKLSNLVKRRQTPVVMAPDTYIRGHRKLRWVSILEGIKKVKRKRETMPKPNNASLLSRQSAAAAAAAAAATGPSAVAAGHPAAPAAPRTNSPAHLSKLKYDHDRQIAEEKIKERMLHAHVQQRFNQASLNVAARGANHPAQQIAMNTPQNVAARIAASQRMNGPQNGPPQPQMNAGVGAPMVPPSIAGLPVPASMRQQAQMQQQQPPFAGMNNGGMSGRSLTPQQKQQLQQQQIQQIHLQRLQQQLQNGQLAGQVPNQMSGQQMPTPQVMAMAQRQQQLQQARLNSQTPMRSNSPMSASSIGASSIGASPMSGSPTMDAAQLSGSPPLASSGSPPMVSAEDMSRQMQMNAMRMQSHSPNMDMRQNMAGQLRRPHPATKERLQNLMRQIAAKQPSLSAQEVQQLAVQHMRRYMQLQAVNQQLQLNRLNQQQQQQQQQMQMQMQMNQQMQMNRASTSPQPAPATTGPVSQLDQQKKRKQPVPKRATKRRRDDDAADDSQ